MSEIGNIKKGVVFGVPMQLQQQDQSHINIGDFIVQEYMIMAIIYKLQKLSFKHVAVI